MIKKKLILIVCLVLTGFLAAADKKLTFYAKVEISDPMGQLLGMIQQGFADMGSRLDRIDLKIVQLRERVDGLDTKVEFYRGLQAASYFEPLGRLRMVQDQFRKCERRTCHGDIVQLIKLLQQDNYVCFDLGSEVQRFLKVCLLETKKLVNFKLEAINRLEASDKLVEHDSHGHYEVNKECARTNFEKALQDIDDLLSRF